MESDSIGFDVLVAGSSLMLYSGYRFAQRADELLSLKPSQRCALALAFLLAPQPRAA